MERQGGAALEQIRLVRVVTALSAHVRPVNSPWNHFQKNSCRWIQNSLYNT